MKLKLIEGQVIMLRCDGCTREGLGGTTPYISASTEEVRTPKVWYQSEDGGMYCQECSAKLVEVDPTRSVNQFYADTAGTEIHRDVFSGE